MSEPWNVASWSLVKSTGFDFGILEQLRVPLADGTPTERIARCVSRLADVCRDPRFQEAVLLSSRAAYEQLRGDLGSGARSNDRRKLLVAAMYLQRMCAKNESTSFFGPVYWAPVGPLRGVEFDPGPDRPPALVTQWTHWAAQAVADVMSADPVVLPHVAPRRPANLAEREGRYIRADYGYWPVGLVELQRPATTLAATILDRCDDTTTAAQIAADLGLDLPTTIAELTHLAEAGLVIFRVEVPFGLIEPLRPLTQLASTLPDDAWAAVLAVLEGHRCAVSAAHGSPERVEAVDAADAAFTAVTGVPAARHAGRHYADRSILVEDGHFPWATFSIGEPLHGYLRQEAPVVLDLLFEVSLERRRRRVRSVTSWFTQTFGSATVALDVVLEAATGLGGQLRADDDRCRESGPSAITDLLVANADRARVDVDLSWARQHASRVRFDTWCVAGADLFVAARDIDALNAGHFKVVVGEVHGLHDQLLQGLWPALHRDRAGFEAEIGKLIDGLADGRICDPVLTHHRKTMARSEVLPEVVFLGLSPRAVGEVCRAADLVMRTVAGELVLESPDLGRIHLTRPPTHSWDDEVESVFSPFCGARLIGAEDMFRTLNGYRHLPRLTIGRTVVHRETWWVPPPPVRSWSSLAPANQVQVLALRDRLGLPDQVFVKFPDEPKPIFVDFEVPVLVDLFARHHVRADAPTRISEMLPGPGELWLQDHTGRHTSELRFGYYRRQEPR